MAEIGEFGKLRATPGSLVELRVTAEFDQLPVIRAVAETLAALANFGADEVADIKLAADEIASELIGAVVSDVDYVTLSFVTSDSALAVTVAARIAAGHVPDRGAFGWHVLETVTDSVTVTESASDSALPGQQVSVEFVKHRTAQ
ncbi:ATP-binding protein [Rhodococcus tibetensis]|uniref:ATP-binding protein n=1 Tax=Rhodococcus tibetensis TaxID=2965064 RepID=A0ABT1QJN9_9NOCA|nr:ATP-binding protein [Rhodococcus sp. FXJ9.536]MCQ4122513.1 ATP-binding protein [Rhodococcus sp. FXJ9.536]